MDRSGKSHLVQMIAERYGATVVGLDIGGHDETVITKTTRRADGSLDVERIDPADFYAIGNPGQLAIIDELDSGADIEPDPAPWLTDKPNRKQRRAQAAMRRRRVR